MAATNDVAVTNEDTPVTTNVVLNDRGSSNEIPRLDAIVTGPENGTAAFDPGEGTVTYTPARDFNGTDSLVYRVVDDAGTASTATLAITIRPVNDAPIAVNDTATTAEDTPVTVAVTANDLDVDGDTLRVTAVTGAQNGTATFAGGSVTYTPNKDTFGQETLAYTVTDGNGGESQALLRITVTPVNDAPVAVADSATTDEDTAVVVDVLANDTDVDGDTLAVGGITVAPASGTATVNADGTITYTPNADFNGTDSFTYEAVDGNGGAASAVVTVRVAPVNDAPVAVDDEATLVEDARLTVLDVLRNDTDIDGDRLRVVAVDEGATLGTVAIGAGGLNIFYTPLKDANGTDTFTYTVADPTGATSSATVTVTLTPVNDAPVAVADSVTTAEDTPLGIDVLANDSDVDGDALTVTAVGAGRLGTTSIAADGRSIDYTPNPDANGIDSFAYTISDGTLTATATVTVTVTPVNDAPVAVDDAATTAEDRAVLVNVLLNDTDVDRDRLTLDAIVDGPENGTAEIIGTFVRYTPNQDFNGTDSLTYRVADGQGGTAEAVLTLTVTPVNDAPVAVNDTATTNEDTPVTLAVLANDTDVDGDALSVVSVGAARLGTVTIAADGQSVTYTPRADANGADSFTYVISDGVLRSTATVSMTVNPVNDAPVAAEDAVVTPEDTPVLINVLANDRDVDGDSLSVARIVRGPANGTAEIDEATGQIRFTPNLNFNGGDSFTYEVTDGSLTDIATVRVGVTPVNDAPVANPGSVTTAEDTAILVNVLANDTDVDGDTLRVASVGRPGNGTAVIDPATGRVLYTPNQDFNGTDTFSYVATDDKGGTATAEITVTVTPVNDAPVTRDDTATTQEDTAVLIDVLANDTDVDGDTLVVSAFGQPANGTVALDAATGQLRYTPDADFNGTDSFRYRADDGQGGQTLGTVTVTVTPVNDAPVAVNDAATMLEDDVARLAVLANDRDVDGDALRITGVGAATNGTTAVVGAEIVYTPNKDFNGTDSFTYTIADPGGLTSEATVSVTVRPVNDAPVANDDTFTIPVGVRRAQLDILENDVDIDSSLNTRSVQIGSEPENGTLLLRNSGVVEYRPIANFVGTDAFTYTVADRQGLGSNFAKVTINVVAPPPPPEPSEATSLSLADVLGGDEVAVGGGASVAIGAAPASLDVASLVVVDTTV